MSSYDVPPERTVSGPAYRTRCLALGFEQRTLCKLLGVNRRTLQVRFQPASVVKTEAILALQMLEHRVLSARYDKMMDEGKKILSSDCGGAGTSAAK